MKKFYITTPLYYVNDKPHIGHTYTTIAADCIARFQRLSGREVYFLTGTDEHGSKIENAAKKAGIETEVFCDKISMEFKKTWKIFNISNDDFIRTTEKRHIIGVEAFFKKIQPDLYIDEYKGLYCEGCEKFLSKNDLVDGLCPDHKKKPEEIFEKNYFFKLKKYLPKLKELITRNKIKIIPETRKKEAMGLFEQKIPDFSVSREKVKWGIKFPFDTSATSPKSLSLSVNPEQSRKVDKNQVVYVWVEALQNYITAPGFGTDERKFKNIWPADIHLMAKDILKFHAIFWPALLLSAKLPLPKTIFAHGFFTIDGQKMSKSLGNVIAPLELVDKYGADAARYLLLSQFPFGQDGDIKKEKFDSKYNADLANELGNLFSRVITMIKNYKINNLNKPEKNLDLIKKELDKFDIFGALQNIWKEIKALNKEIDEKKPWELAKKDPKLLKEVLSELYFKLWEISYNLEPFMPDTTKKIQDNLTSLSNKAIFPRIKV